MKYLFIGLLLFQFSSLWGMELADDAWPKYIISLSNNYSLYLRNQYACVCTRFLHHLLYSETAMDENKKVAQLNKLRKHLAKKDWDLAEVWNFLTNTMAPFNDDYGCNFLQSACFALNKLMERRVKILPLAEELPESSWPQCIVCTENYSSKLFVPCGHLVLCSECYSKIEKTANWVQCPMCKGAHSGVEDLALKTINEFIKLNQQKPNTFFQACKHLAHTTDFDANLPCQQCGKSAALPLRVFPS